MELLLTTPPFNVFEQMALDDVLVRLRPGACTLRFYHWTREPAVTCGYAQPVSQVRAQVAPADGSICRRPTGGGLVFHKDDLTFSLIFVSQDTPGKIYQNLHAAIQAALVLGGTAAGMFDTKLPACAYAPSQQNQATACFVRPVENDLLAPNGQKILGGAIRRFGNTVLYQGSLQVPGARINPALKEAVIQGVRGFWQTDLKIKSVPAEWLQAARSLAQTHYQTAAWTEKF